MDTNQAPPPQSLDDFLQDFANWDRPGFDLTGLKADLGRIFQKS